MKKLAVGLFVGLSLIFTSTVFAMSLMTEAEMRAVIGQAGVSIQIDYIMFEQFIGSLSYTDDDGTTGDPASVVISDQHIIKTFSGMTSENDFIEQFKDMTGGVTPIGVWNKFSALTIDVGKGSILSAINNDVLAYSPEPIITAVLVNLPTLLINTSSEEYSIGLNMAGASNDGADFVTIKTDGNVMAVLGGTVEIAAH